MALITRVSRLFRADLHAVLDHIEEPDVLLRQAVREMQASIDEDQQRLKTLEFELTRMQARRGDLERTLARLDEELEVCFASGKDDLARGVVKRKLENRARMDKLEQRGRELTERREETRASLEQNRPRLDAMRQKAALLATENRESRERGAWMDEAGLGVEGVSEQEVDVALLREKQRRESQPGAQTGQASS